MRYQPTAIPTDAPRGLGQWLALQLRALADAIAAPEVTAVQFAPLAAEPARYQEGTLAYANGTDWNPGGGAGLYQRTSGAWVKL